MEAKPGKEAAVEALLKGGLPIVAEEPETIAWFSCRERTEVTVLSDGARKGRLLSIVVHCC